MKVVILAGGFGTRISEYTKTIPKPMIEINRKPILHRIMDHYSSYGYKDFYIALGYKGEVIKKYFKKKKIKNWNINLIDTGKKTMTGGRLKRLGKVLNKETFLIILFSSVFLGFSFYDSLILALGKGKEYIINLLFFIGIALIITIFLIYLFENEWKPLYQSFILLLFTISLSGAAFNAGKK